MARARNIKPSFFINDKLADCEPLARLLFAGLWTVADREGRLERQTRKIKAQILPYDDCDAESLLKQLENKGFILSYYVENIQYIQILKFKEHQNPHVKEGASTIPAPDLHQTSTVQNVPYPLSPIPLIDSPIPIRAEKIELFPLWLDLVLWQDFVNHRKAIKAPLTKRAEDLAIGELSKLTQKGYSQKELIEKTILNGWKTFYEPKEQYANKSNNGYNHKPTQAEQIAEGIARLNAEYGGGIST